MLASSLKKKTGPDLIGTRVFTAAKLCVSMAKISAYAVAAFTCDNAAATSFKSGTTGMS